MEAPNMISSKDLDYLSDIFEWNFNASKKAYHFSQEIKLQQVQQISSEIAKMHSQICRTIISILGGSNE